MTNFVRTFTLNEANAMIPALEKRLVHIMELRSAQKMLSKDVQDLHDIWGEQILDEKNMDHKFYSEKAKRRNEVSALLAQEVEKINILGCVVKDIDNGLVDFYFDMGGELVFLCWRTGEKQISHWHGLDTGFNNRQPLETLKAAMQ